MYIFEGYKILILQGSTKNKNNQEILKMCRLDLVVNAKLVLHT